MQGYHQSAKLKGIRTRTRASCSENVAIKILWITSCSCEIKYWASLLFHTTSNKELDRGLETRLLYVYTINAMFVWCSSNYCGRLVGLLYLCLLHHVGISIMLYQYWFDFL